MERQYFLVVPDKEIDIEVTDENQVKKMFEDLYGKDVAPYEWQTLDGVLNMIGGKGIASISFYMNAKIASLEVRHDFSM